MTERRATYRARRVDANQGAIVKALKEAGYEVFDTHTVGRGYPDLAVNVRGVIVLIEVKSGEGDLTPAEIEFFAAWNNAPVYMVRTPAEALAVCDIAMMPRLFREIEA